MPSSDLSSVSLGERTLDEALCAALTSSPGFRDVFLRAIGCRQWSDGCGGTFSSAVRSVYEAHPNSDVSGETDVLATWTSRSGAPLDVRIEHKADAQFQERQGERYAARAALSPERASMTVLIAPQRYLETANVQARFFRNMLAAEKVLEWMREHASTACAGHIQSLQELLTRLDEGRVLGSKGLYVDLYAAIHDELQRRSSPLRITNRPTDWIHLMDENCVAGVKYVFRIRQNIAEIAMTYAFQGDRNAIASVACPPLVRADSGSSTFLRANSPRLSEGFARGAPIADDIALIVDALESCAAEWARIRSSVPASAFEAQ